MRNKIGDNNIDLTYNKDAKPVLNEENYELFKYFIKERYSIRLKKKRVSQNHGLMILFYKIIGLLM